MPIPVRPKPFLPPGCPGGMYAGLARLSAGCPPDRGRLHTCYSPVRRSPAEKASFLPAAPRLACVKPAASVHPEPGSNSPLLVSCFQNSSNCLLPVQDSFFHCWNLDGTYLFVPVLFKQLSLLCLVAKFQSSRRNPDIFPDLLSGGVVPGLRLQSYSKNPRCANFSATNPQNNCSHSYIYLIIFILKIC